MSDMKVNNKHKAQAPQQEAQHVQNKKKTENSDFSHADPVKENNKKWENFSDNHAKIAAQSVDQKHEEKKQAERVGAVQAGDIQRQLELQRMGIRG